jgi:hypothetical protein
MGHSARLSADSLETLATPGPASCPQCGGPKSASALRCYTCAWPGRVPRAPLERLPEVEVIDVQTSSHRVTSYRVYCFSCGRSSEVPVAPRHPGRCDACGGSMLVEFGS